MPEGWAARAEVAPRGWDVEPVIRRYEERTAGFRAMADGSGPLAVPLTPAVDPEPNAFDQNTLLVFGDALLRAAWGRDCLSVLDFGGGFGFGAFFARAWLPEDFPLSYEVVELPGIAAAGRVAVPEVSFVDEERAFARPGAYDLVVASSSLQYVVDWKGLLAAFARASRRSVLVTDTPFVTGVPSYVVLQRTQSYGIDTEYLGWVVSRSELAAEAASLGLVLEREYLLAFRPRVHGAPERPQYRAFRFAVA